MANIRAVEKKRKFFCTASPPVLARTKRAVNEVWLPLRIQNGTNKPVTVTFHRNNAKRLTEYFKGRSHAENHSDRHSALSNLSPHGIQEHKGKASRDKDGLPSLRDVGADIQLR